MVFLNRDTTFVSVIILNNYGRIEAMRKGFTLIELIVVVGIVALIASIALANFPSFRGRLALDREAGKIALAFRTAQQYSSGVRRFEGQTFTEPLSVELQKCSGLYEAQFPAYSMTVSTQTDADRKSYSIYADPDCDRISESFPNDLIETTALENNLRIDDICINIDSAAPTCGVAKLDVWYVRPNPTLLLTVNNVFDPNQQSAKIILKAEDGSKKSVVVRKTGQVSIQNEK